MTRFPATYARACWLAVAAVGWIGIAPAAYGTEIGYDIVFACSNGCTTGIDEPTGMLFLDDSALVTDGTKILNDFGGSLMITGVFATYEDDLRFPSFPQVTVTGGEVTAIDYASGVTPSLSIFRLNPSGTWSEPEPVTNGAGGSYTLERKPTGAVPEPNSATLFTLGAVLTAARVRRMARS